MAMTIKLRGVRGSLPTPTPPEFKEKLLTQHLEAFEKSGKSPAGYLSSLSKHEVGGYGGNTACIDVSTEKANIIIDAGSGIRALGESLMAGPCGQGKGVVDLFFTHFHWDHLVGLPFFIPIFIPGNRINVYSVQKKTEDIFKHVFQKPFFPVPYEKLGANIVYHELEPREAFEIGDLSLTPYQLDHPDPCWGYKIQHGGKTFSYCVDTECVRTSPEELGKDLPLYQGVDLMVFDAQYTFSEALQKVDWGHAAAPVGLDLAIREGVKEVIFVHHDPASSDEKIAQAEEQTARYYKALEKEAKIGNQEFKGIKWEFGHEGMEFHL